MSLSLRWSQKVSTKTPPVACFPWHISTGGPRIEFRSHFLPDNGADDRRRVCSNQCLEKKTKDIVACHSWREVPFCVCGSLEINRCKVLDVAFYLSLGSIFAPLYFFCVPFHDNLRRLLRYAKPLYTMLGSFTL